MDNPIIKKVSEGGCLSYSETICYSSMYVDSEEDFRKLLKDSGPHKTIIEIGTFNGISSAVMSEYAEKIYTFDIDVRPQAQKVHEFLGIKNIERRKVTENIKQDIAEIFKKEDVTLCFVDGEHWFGQCEKDFYMVQQCKNILFHDYNIETPEVWAFCNSLPADGFDIIKTGYFFMYRKK